MYRSESRVVPAVLAASIFLALTGPAFGWGSRSPESLQGSAPGKSNQAAQNGKSKNAKKSKKNETKKSVTLNRVIVTGSLIPETEVQTSTPRYSISREQLEDEGVNSFADAIEGLAMATGAVDGPAFTTGFTPGARTARLFGLPSSFTLYMINGKPIAPYPLPYGGVSNFTNLSNIPITMLSRIELVPGGQSSLYGSSAVAGVVNIILRKRMKGFRLDVMGGGYTQGGGQMGRVSFSGGYNTDKLHVIYAVQATQRQPMFASQRELTATNLSNPDPDSTYAWPAIRLHYSNMPSTSYIDPNLSGGCDAISYYAGGTVGRYARPSLGTNGKGPGYYCASMTARGVRTLRNKKKSTASYIHASYDVSPNMKLYASFLYDYGKNQSNTGPGALGHQWKANDGNGIYNAITGRIDHYTVGFTAEEMGGVDAMYRLDSGREWNGTVGIEGGFGDSDWQYAGYLTRSDYTELRNQIRPVKDKVNQFFEDRFLGPQLGVRNGLPVYKPDDTGFYQPITPEQFQSFSEMSPVHSVAWVQKANFKVYNQYLFELPAGPVGFAGVAGISGSRWKSITGPRALNGYYWGWKGARGKGSRRHYSIGSELRLPLLSTLTADLSGRYDHYKNVGGGADGQPTYRIGLAFRPTRKLLIRANQATSFLAPDLTRSFAGPSESFNTAIDRYKCEKYQPNLPLSRCSWQYTSYRKETSGNPYLKSVTATSSGFGAVWEPVRRLTFNADYYHIAIKNRVVTQSTGRILTEEAECRLGILDIKSSSCVDVLNRVVRGPVTPDRTTTLILQEVHAVPINRAKEKVWGIVGGMKYNFRTRKLGRFYFGLRYNTTLGHTYQEFSDSEVIHYLHDPDLLNFYKTKARARITWNYKKLRISATEYWSGSLPNHAANRIAGWDAAGAGRLPPWIRYNLTVNYKFSRSTSLRLAINNIGNRMPPLDLTYNSWPYYHYATQNLWGQFVSLRLRMRFGAR